MHVKQLCMCLFKAWLQGSEVKASPSYHRTSRSMQIKGLVMYELYSVHTGPICIAKKEAYVIARYFTYTHAHQALSSAFFKAGIFPFIDQSANLRFEECYTAVCCTAFSQSNV